MKKIILGILSLMFSYSLLSAQTYAQEFNNTGKIKKGVIESKKEEVGEKAIEKIRTVTGVVKSIDAEKKIITMDSIKKKGESISFGYDGLKMKDGNDLIDPSSLKVGDRIKIKYSGDITSPKIEKMMMIKEKFMEKEKKEEKDEMKSEKKEMKKNMKDMEAMPSKKSK